MIYNLESATGEVVLTPHSKLVYKGLELIGRDSIDWNEPMQQNFVKIVDELGNKLNSIVNKDILPDKADTYTLGSLEKPFKDLYVGAIQMKEPLLLPAGKKLLTSDGNTLTMGQGLKLEGDLVAQSLNGKQLLSSVPLNAKFTDTHLSDTEIGNMGYIKSQGSFEDFSSAFTASK